jgi:5-formyltetrahydrofolate cyclo-ligase
MTSAASIRKKIRKHRQILSQHYRYQSAITASKLLSQLTCFRNARNIAVYLPANGELDPLPVLQKASDMGKTCFLPVLHPMQQKLWFAPWQAGDPLGANRFGIPEPKRLHGDLTPPWALDLVLTPLVAFDKHGTRLGMGGGYYDRSFAYLKHRRYFRKPLLIGYGYEFQLVKKLQRNHWDIPIHMAITEQQVHRFSL